LTDDEDDPNKQLVAYLALRTSHPAWFENPEGGVRIEVDPPRIRSIERLMGDRYAARGLPRDWAEVGIMYRDPYLMVLRDAVWFPNGDPGVHHRCLRFEGEPSGIGVLAVMDGRILLLRHFRHAVRQWCWEIPRGLVENGQSLEDAVRAELREEVEAEASEVAHLGLIHGSTGFMGQGVVAFLAHLTRIGEPAHGEGITGFRFVSPAEFDDMARSGEITESYTLSAVLLARLKGLM
jgi:ADP-ribose pyrophosphatase